MDHQLPELPERKRKRCFLSMRKAAAGEIELAWFPGGLILQRLPGIEEPLDEDWHHI